MQTEEQRQHKAEGEGAEQPLELRAATPLVLRVFSAVHFESYHPIS